MFVKPVFKNNSRPALCAIFDELEHTLNSLSKNTLNLRYNDGASALGLADYRHVLASMTSNEVLGDTARNTVLNACLKAEHIAAGAGLLASIIIVYRFKKLQMSYRGNADQSITDDMVKIFKGSRDATTQECFEIIKSYINDEYAYDMLFEACHMAGGAGQLFLDHQGKNVSSLSLRSGYRFPAGYVQEMIKAVSNNSIELYDVDVLIIDGIIESVGEIHHVLEEYSKTRKPLIVFSRGFSEEVIATIVLNKMRGALNLVPVQVHYDLDGVNMLNDIAIVCETDVVSSLKGELISSISLDEIPTIEKAVVNDHSIFLYAGNRTASVRAHIGELLKKRKKSRHDDARQIIDRRIQQLSPRAVHVQVGPEHGDHRGLLIDRIDTGLRMFKDVSRDGILVADKIEPQSFHLHQLINYFKKFGITNIPAKALHVGLIIGCQTAELLIKTSVFLVDDSLHSD